ncbi:MAG: endonuclease III [Thermoleophilia bacterium]|nr:endonuclease III [Thermoleophilia bacterium]
MRPRPGTRAHLAEVVHRLAGAWGPRPWARRRPPVDELVTTILSQNTSDANQHRAFAALRARFGDWEAVRAAPRAEVVAAIRRGGLAELKGPRIQAVLDALAAGPRPADLEWLGDLPPEEGMAHLTGLPGVGPKTAACVLCFAFGLPVLPVDTHVHRIALRLRVVPPGTDAARTQARLSAWVPAPEVYATHMRLIDHGRAVCRARAPRCRECVLLDLCPAGRSAA